MSETPRKRVKISVMRECRACLANISDNSCCVDIFRGWRNPPWSGPEVSIAEHLSKLANVQITCSDPHSKIICKKCCNKLQDAVHFAWAVQNTDKVLKARHIDCINENPSWPKPIQVDKNTSNALNEMTVEVKQEVLSGDEYDMNETSDLNEQRLEIKIEPEEITPAPSSLVAEDKDLHSLLQPVETTNTNGETNLLEESELEDIKDEPMSEEETEPVTDMPQDCMLCMKTFNTVKDLKAHVIAVHSYKTVTSPQVDRPHVCATCSRSFATRTDLFVHETCHSKFACYVCDKKFDSFTLLTKHRSTQCTKTSVLPRMKTLEDVRRPKPVYYILNKSDTSSTSLSSTTNPPEALKRASPITEPNNPSLIKSYSAQEQIELEKNRIVHFVDPQKNSANGQTSSINETNTDVEYLLTAWNEVPEKVPEPRVIETVPEKAQSDDETNSVKQHSNKVSAENSQLSKSIKITCILGETYKSNKNTVNESDVTIKTAENVLKVQEIDMNRKGLEICAGVKDDIEDILLLDTSQTKKESSNMQCVSDNATSDSNETDNNKVKKDETNESESKVGDKVDEASEVTTKTKQTEVDYNIDESKYEIIYESDESESIDQKVKPSEVNNTKDRESEIGNITKKESEVNDIMEDTLEVDTKTIEDEFEVDKIEKASDLYKTKHEEQTKETNSVADITDGKSPEVNNKTDGDIQQTLSTFEITRVHSIPIHASGVCASNKDVSYHNEVNLATTEKLEPLSPEMLPKDLDAQSHREDMEIQLEIHSINKDDVMEIDIDLESEIKS